MPFSHIPLSEYKARRARVLEKIGVDAVAIFFAAPLVHRNGDTEYAYRQDSDFYYLTGFTESQAVLVLRPGAETPVVLFNQLQDAKIEQWTGPRVGQQDAVSHYGVDVAYSINDIDAKLPTLLAGKKIIYYPIGVGAGDNQVLQWIQRAKENTRHMAMPDLIAAQKLTAPMRLLKSATEIELLSTSAQISTKAHAYAMQHCRVGMKEYQLAGEYVYQFTQAGARDVAYLPIVGGGKNACVLHYIANHDTLQDGDLVLIDAGSEYHYYCADITRTFPVNGRFSAPQRALYEVVLNAYLAGLALIKPGGDWPGIQKIVAEVLTQGLVDLKILNGSVSDLIEQKALSKFFMHGPGHWLGLDVHDVGAYKINDKPTVFEPHMVLTLEPGLYIKQDDSVDEKWWNTGIRIEDDILVTSTGHRVLSEGAPILPDEIEQLMR